MQQREIHSKPVTETLPIEYAKPGLPALLDLSVKHPAEQFKEAVAAWLQKTPSRNTAKSYAGDLGQFLRFMGLSPDNVEQLKDVRPIHVSAWRDSLQTQQLANASIRRKLTTLRALFSFLRECGLVTLNPAHGKFVAAPPVSRDGKTVGLVS